MFELTVYESHQIWGTVFAILAAAVYVFDKATGRELHEAPLYAAVICSTIWFATA
jgi:heme/copper-type cytochrome/quinol oxidase subunit 1